MEMDFYEILHLDIQQKFTGHFYVGLFWRRVTPTLLEAQNELCESPSERSISERCKTGSCLRV